MTGARSVGGRSRASPCTQERLRWQSRFRPCAQMEELRGEGRRPTSSIRRGEMDDSGLYLFPF